MTDLLNDYKKRYKLRWNEDCEFSERFMPRIEEILNETTLPKKIQNNVGTEEDLKGHDLTVILQIGVRIRRYDNSITSSYKGRYICYVNYDDFTEDDKERDTMKDHVYFFGYSLPDESGLKSYIIFDHNDFRKARDNKLLRCIRKPNKEHGLVWFNCYPIWDIIKHCKIYGKYGRIGWKEKRSRYTKTIPTSDATRTSLNDFFHSAFTVIAREIRFTMKFRSQGG